MLNLLSLSNLLSEWNLSSSIFPWVGLKISIKSFSVKDGSFQINNVLWYLKSSKLTAYYTRALNFPILNFFKSSGPQHLINYAHPYLPPGIDFRIFGLFLISKVDTSSLPSIRSIVTLIYS